MNKKTKTRIILAISFACLLTTSASLINLNRFTQIKSSDDYTNSVTFDSNDISYALAHNNTVTKNGITITTSRIAVENNKILFDGIDGETTADSDPTIAVTTISYPVTGTLSGGGYTCVGFLGYDGTDYGKLGITSYGNSTGSKYLGYAQVHPNKPELQNITPVTSTDYPLASKIKVVGKKGYDLHITSFTLSWACKYAHPDVPKEDKTIYVSSPTENETVDILDAQTRAYINDFRAKGALKANDYLIDINEVNTTEHTPRANAYYRSGMEYNKGINISFYSSADTGTTFNIVYSKNSDLTNGKTITTQVTDNKIYNLEPETKYYYQIKSSDLVYASEIRSFTTSEGPRTFKTEKTSNIRDIGGLMTKSGKRIKYGLVFRGPELNKDQYVASSGSTHYKTLTEETKTLLVDELGIKQEIDFRSASEIRDVKNLTSDLGLADYFSSCMKVDSGWTPAYSYICKDTYNLSMYKYIFQYFTHVDTKPIYMHCVGGLDRTGTVAFLLEGMLGVSFTDACLDYELSTFSGTERLRDVNCTDKDGFVNMITHMYNNTAKSGDFPGFDPAGTHDLQTVCTNILLKCGITQQEIDTIKSLMLEA